MEIQELLDVTGETCCTCFESFEDGQKVLTLGCPHGHVMCETCYDLLLKSVYDDETKRFFVELVDRRANGQDLEEELEIEDLPVGCPVCRGEAGLASIHVARNYYKGTGKNNTDPITIT